MKWRQLDMITAQSFSERQFKSLYFDTLKQRFGAAAFYSVIMLVLYPLLYFIETQSALPSEPLRYHFYGNGAAYCSFAGFFVYVMCIAIPMLTAVPVFSYLHEKKASDVFHSLPVRREKLFAAKYLAGLTAVWVPVILSFLMVTACAFYSREIYSVYFAPEKIIQEMLCWMVITGVIYTITACACVLSGTGFNSVILSLVMCGGIPTVLAVVRWMMEAFLLGFAGFGSDGVLEWSNMALLSPFTIMIFHMTRDLAEVGSSLYSDDYTEIMFARSNTAILCWFAVALLLAAASTAAYKSRKSELAECANSTSVFSRAAQYTAAFAGGGMFGMIFYAVFDGMIMFITGLVLGGCITFATTEALLSHGFRTLPKAFVHMAASTGVLLLTAAVVVTGFFGFESRIPEAEEVENVAITYFGRYKENKMNREFVELASPEGIEIVRQLHENIYEESQQGEVTWEQTSDVYPQITYRLKDGSELVRRYTAVSNQAALGLVQLENLEEFKRQTNPAYTADAEKMNNVRIIAAVNNDDIPMELTVQQKQQLLIALQKDAANETAEDISEPQKALFWVSWENVIGKDSGEGYDIVSASSIMVTVKFKNTLAFMSNNGYEPQVKELTEMMKNPKISRAAVFNEKYRIWNRSNAGIAYISPETFLDETAYIFEEPENYTIVDREDILTLYDAACHQMYGNDSDNMLVYFEFEGVDMIRPMFVPKAKVSQLAQKYAPKTSNDNENDVVLAQAIV